MVAVSLEVAGRQMVPVVALLGEESAAVAVWLEVFHPRGAVERIWLGSSDKGESLRLSTRVADGTELLSARVVAEVSTTTTGPVDRIVGPLVPVWPNGTPPTPVWSEAVDAFVIEEVADASHLILQEGGGAR